MLGRPTSADVSTETVGQMVKPTVIVQQNLSTGPFYATEDVGRGCAGSESVWAGDLMFDAHRANAVYGESTVQPSSCRLFLCIKA